MIFVQTQIQLHASWPTFAYWRNWIIEMFVLFIWSLFFLLSLLNKIGRMTPSGQQPKWPNCAFCHRISRKCQYAILQQSLYKIGFSVFGALISVLRIHSSELACNLLFNCSPCYMLSTPHWWLQVPFLWSYWHHLTKLSLIFIRSFFIITCFQSIDYFFLSSYTPCLLVLRLLYL